MTDRKDRRYFTQGQINFFADSLIKRHGGQWEMIVPTLRMALIDADSTLR